MALGNEIYAIRSFIISIEGSFDDFQRFNSQIFAGLNFNYDLTAKETVN